MTACLFVSGLHGRRKPDAAVFQAAAACLHVPVEQVLFVGDKLEDDIRGAHEVGMKTAWLRHGARWRAGRLAGRSRRCADVMISSIGEVVDVLGLAAP